MGSVAITAVRAGKETNCRRVPAGVVCLVVVSLEVRCGGEQEINGEERITFALSLSLWVGLSLPLLRVRNKCQWHEVPNKSVRQLAPILLVPNTLANPRGRQECNVAIENPSLHAEALSMGVIGRGSPRLTNQNQIATLFPTHPPPLPRRSMLGIVLS